MPSENIVDVELHDARVERISAFRGAMVEVEFDHICSYHQNPDGTLETWSSQGTIRFIGITFLEMVGSISSTDYVTEGFLIGLDDQPISLVTITSQQKVKSFNLLLAGSGARIRILANEAVLSKLQPMQKLLSVPDS